MSTVPLPAGLAPGDPAPATGLYIILDARGRDTRFRRWCWKDRPLPPLGKDTGGRSYMLLDNWVRHSTEGGHERGK